MSVKTQKLAQGVRLYHNRHRLRYTPPTLENPAVVDWNAPGNFYGTPPTSGKVYLAQSADASGIPPGCTIARYADASTTVFPTADFIYLFATDSVTKVNNTNQAKDFIYRFPENRILETNGIQIQNGRNVFILGGHLKGLVAATSSIRAVLRLLNQTGTIYIEGLKVDANLQYGLDCIDVGSNDQVSGEERANVILQNVYTTGTTSTTSGFHADGFQYYGSTRWTYMDKVSVNGNYQGYFLDQQAILDGIEMHRCDATYLDPTTATGYIFYLHSSQNYAPNDFHKPVILDRVWADQRNNGAFNNWGLHSIYPPTNVGSWASVLAPDGKSATFPYFPVFGKVIKGRPPFGSWADPNEVGLNYASPGYLSDALVEYELMESGDRVLLENGSGSVATERSKT